MTKYDIMLTLDGESDGWQTTYSYDEVIRAMDVYAKQESIAFVNFLQDYYINNTDALHCAYSTEELYSLYLQSKNK